MNKKYDTFWSRFWAGFLDGLVLTPLNLFDLVFLQADKSLFIVIPWLVISHSIYFIYSIVLHWKYGQTIGKRIMKISVVDVSESRGLNFIQALLRDSIPLIIQLLLLVKLVIVVIQNGRYKEEAIQQETLLLIAIGCISLVWFFIEAVTMLTNSKRRALHDFIAKTVVIKTISKG